MHLSIITINYNNIQGLKRTINSVISQKSHCYEWILIDGGSTDGSLDVIKENQEQFSFWCSEKDSGIYNAMNKGIRHATGDYLLFLNSGDYLANNDIIEKVIHEEFNEDIIYGYILREYNNSLIPQKNFTKCDFTLSDFLRNSLPHQATFIKKDAFDKWGLYDEKYKIASDWEFFVKSIIVGNARVKYIDMPISVFEDGGISGDCNQKNETRSMLIEMFPERILKDIEAATSLSEINDNKLCSILFRVLYRFRFFLKKIQ